MRIVFSLLAMGITLLLTAQPASATMGPARLSDSSHLYQYLSWVEDPSNELSLGQALSSPRRQHNLDGKTPTFGFRHSTFWFFLPLLNDTEQEEWIIKAGRPHMDSLTLLVLDAQGTPVARIRNGDTLTWQERPWPSTSLAFPVQLTPGQHYTLAFKARSSGVIELPLEFLSVTAFMQQDAIYLGLMGLCLGGILAMLLFNIFLYLSIRDRSYLIYVGYLCGLLLFAVSRQGFGVRWLWPHTPEINNALQALGGCLGVVFILLFCLEFFKLHHLSPKVARVLSLITTGYLLLMGYALAISDTLPIRLMTASGGLVLVPLLGIGVWQLLQGNRSAFHFLLSFAPYGLMVPVFMLKTYGIIEHHPLLDHGFEISASLAAWLLSLALASRFTFLQAENERIQRQATSELEQRVAERTHELNQALETRSQFLAVMSHEIRTPLNGILGTTEMLQDRIQDSELHRLLRIIEQSGNSLLTLINDILDFSSIESGRIPINHEAFDPRQLVEEVIQVFEHRSRHHNLEFQVELDPQLGSPCSGDPLRLRQILMNLVGNATKFTEAGSIRVRAFRDLHEPDQVLFEVLDTGVGIPESVLGKLFGMFQQGDSSTRRRYGGAGLGLAICRQLVELMNGEIGVQSTVGQGSRFWFRLPLPLISQPPTLTGEPEPPAAELGGLRILVVDDNRTNLTVAQGILNKLGHRAEPCDSGPEAIATLLNDRGPFDLILMDCEMPDMDGFETAREIIRLQQEGRIGPAPVLALTAHAVPDKIAACHEAGMKGHIAKPINSERLAMAIKEALEINS